MTDLRARIEAIPEFVDPVRPTSGWRGLISRDAVLAVLDGEAVERPTDEDVRRELHRVYCGNVKHLSELTGDCRLAPNIARGLRYWASR